MQALTAEMQALTAETRSQVYKYRILHTPARFLVTICDIFEDRILGSTELLIKYATNSDKYLIL